MLSYEWLRLKADTFLDEDEELLLDRVVLWLLTRLIVISTELALVLGFVLLPRLHDLCTFSQIVVAPYGSTAAVTHGNLFGVRHFCGTYTVKSNPASERVAEMRKKAELGEFGR